MYRPRIIPVLLLKGKGLVKTARFKKPVYIGDPINAVKIFNDLKADELVFLDVMASREQKTVSPHVVQQIADEAYMPFAVGGGIRTVEQVQELISKGAEKVVVNTGMYRNPGFVKKTVSMFGSQSIIGSVDVKKSLFGKYKVYISGGKEKIKMDLKEYVLFVESLGVGEILINSIDRDGTMTGYDHELVSSVAKMVDIPVIACGGAENLEDMANVIYRAGAHAAAAGSLFVFHGRMKGVLINYPDKKEMDCFFLNHPQHNE